MTKQLKMTKQPFAWITGIILSFTTLSTGQPAQATPLSTPVSSSSPQQSNTHPIDFYPPNFSGYRIETYYSSMLNSLRTYGVTLPPDYDMHPEQRYPVIFLLHGGHGDPTDWFKKGDALTTLQQLYSENRLPPSIVITPDGYDNRGSSPYADPQYLDGPDGKIATAIGDELVTIVQQRYRTLPTPNFWAIGGLSSGGWGAINIGLHFPNHFSVLFSHSGYFVDQNSAENSPLTIVESLPESTLQQLRIYLDSGEDDRLYLSQSREFEQELDRLHVTSVFHAFPGAHSWSYWREHLADSLTFVGEQFQGAKLAHTDEP
jgi:enterochelin esterase-like enzyme